MVLLLILLALRNKKIGDAINDMGLQEEQVLGRHEELSLR